MKTLKKVLLYISIVILLLVTIYTVNARFIQGRSVASKVIEDTMPTMMKLTDMDTDFGKSINEYLNTPRKEAYRWPDSINIDSSVSSYEVDGMKVYELNPEGRNEKKILYIHGGAYVYEMSDSHIKMLDKLARNLDINVVIPIYPLTPEHTYNESYDKILSLYETLLEKASSENIIFMGDSAGGGHSLGLSMYLNEIGVNQPGQLILLSPWLDVTMSNQNITEELKKHDKVLSTDGLIVSGKYWAGEQDPKHYQISPMFGQMNNLPQITIFVGTYDIFYPDCLLLHEKLEDAGGSSTLKVYDKMQHVFPILPIPEADQALSEIEEIIGK